MQEKKGFPWGWVLGGCAIAVVLIIIAVVGGGYFLYNKAQEFSEDMKDPKKREAKVMEVLGAETLPEGLHPIIGFSVPMVMDVAILGDEPSTEYGEPPGDPGERGFIYFSMISSGHQRQELQEFFEGKRSNSSMLRQYDVDIDVREVLGRGELESKGQKIRWVSHRGDRRHTSSSKTVLMTMMLFECPDKDRRMRLGVLFAPDPGVEVQAEQVELTGTIADEAEIASIVSHFQVCE
jgi:hypothetical protein